MDRRRFIQQVGATALAGVGLRPVSAQNQAEPRTEAERLASSLHGRIPRFVPNPVWIETIEVLRVEADYYVRVRSTDGAVGIAAANQRMHVLHPLLTRLVAPYFKGKDARDLPSLVEGVYRHGRNYKYAGMPFWNCVGHVELAVWDLLGQVSGEAVWALIVDKPVREYFPVYLSSFNRHTTPKKEVEWMAERLATTDATACKLKVGGRMSKNKDAMPGRSKALVRLARKTFGDKVKIFVDANGSYDADHAIELGRFLQDHNVGFFEEPCPWQQYEQTQVVAAALDMTVAGGEQDTSLDMFRRMVRGRIVDLVQPDVLYAGGIVRCLHIANMAARAGLKCTPHSSKPWPINAGMLHLAAVVENLGPYQEYPAYAAKSAKLKIPTSPGLGVEHDPDRLAKAKPVLPS